MVSMYSQLAPAATAVGSRYSNPVFTDQPFVYLLLDRLEYGAPQRHVSTLKFFPSLLGRLRAEGVVVHMAPLTRR